MVLQTSGPISLNDMHQEAAGFTGAVAVEVRPSSGSFFLRSNNDWTSVKVWAIGGGGSGGAASTDAGREKVATGGGAGGTAVRTYLRSSGISSFSATIGSGGASVSAAGGGGRRSGRSGGTTTFDPNVGTTISASGGERGYGSATDPANGDNSDVYVNGWGYAHESNGGVGSGGQDNYTGGGATLLTRGGDGSGAKGGGSVNLVGQAVSGLNGPEISGAGGPHFSARASQPVYAQEFTLKNGSAAFSFNFQGGKGVQHSSGQAGTAENGLAYGGGGGGVAAEGGTNYSGSGSNGAVILVYLDEGISGTTVTINDEDVRALIDKASGAQSSFSEFYGSTSGGIPVAGYPVNIDPIPESWVEDNPNQKVLATNTLAGFPRVYSGNYGTKFITTETDLLYVKDIPYYHDIQSTLPVLGSDAGVYAGWRPKITTAIITERVNLSERRVYPPGLTEADASNPTDYPASAHHITVLFYNETASGGYNPNSGTEHAHIEGRQTLSSIPTNSAPQKVVLNLKWGSKSASVSLPLLSADTADTLTSQIWAPEVHTYTFAGPGVLQTGTSFGNGVIEYTGDRFTSSDLNKNVIVEVNITKP
jgi:hypothetical protein